MSGVNRPSLTKEYINNQVTHLKSIHPEIDESLIWDFVRAKAQERLKRPKVEMITHDNFNSNLEQVDLLTHVRKNNNKTITPSGSWYETSDVRKAPDIDFMLSRLSLRSDHKKKMLSHREHGQFMLAMLEDFRQGMVKIGSNSVIGGSGSQFSILFDLENFNGITSISRHGTMGAYIFTERFISHNFQFLSDEEVINHIVTTVRACPPEKQVMELIDKYKIAIPFGSEIIESLVPSMENYYKVGPARVKLNQVAENLKPHERAFLAYHMNFKYMVEQNPDMFRRIIDRIFDIDNLEVDPNTKVEKISSLYSSGMFQLISVACGQIVNGRIIGKMHDPNDSEGNYDPEAVKKIITIGNHIKKELDNLQPLFELFMYAKCVIPTIDNQKDLSRRTVALSDTDSVIFSVNDWIKWYCGQEEMSNRATLVSNLIMYWLIDAISAYIFHMSYCRGAINEFTSMISIKNEYMFPVLVRCDIAKHYFGWITVQEGKILPKPKLEIKGLNFKSSTLPGITNKFTEQLIIDILNDISKEGKINVSDYVMRVMEYEQTIHDSLRKGELLYINTMSIKHKVEYKNPEKSVYRNFLIWEDLFADKYGPIRLPTKVPMITLIPKIMNNPKYLDWLCTKNKKAYDKLMEYDEDVRSKLTRLPLSGTLGHIPEELIPCINLRSIIYKNVSPSQLVLRSFKVDLNNNGKRQLLFSDVYSDAINLD